MQRALLVSIALGIAGCSAVIDGSGGLPSGTGGSGAGAGSDPSNSPLDPATGLPSACDPTQVLAAPAPLLRLTNLEYANSVRDLFPTLSIPAPNLPPDNHDEGFDTLASAQATSPALIEAFDAQAAAVSKLVAQNLAPILPCSQTAPVDEVKCGTQFIQALLPRAYRRAPTQDELTRVTQLFTTARTSWGFGKAIELLVRAVLNAPQFLYRIEIGSATPDRPDSTPLTGAELAARLSYLFWDAPPDAALAQAAASGELGTAAGVESQARRLLNDPRAHQALSVFTSQWLRFEKMNNLTKSQALFPSFTASTAASLRSAAATYVDYLLWQRGDFQSFFLDDHAFVNDDLAPLYGVPAPGSSKLTLVATDRTERAGILTLAGLLAGFAHETSDAPVLRGVFVLDRLLCDAPPPPPKGIPPLAADVPGAPAMTTRQKVEITHVTPACMGCHEAIDGIGFGFEHYDAIGRYRTLENGLPVDAKSELKNTLDADGPFDGAVELAQKLARSKQAQACVARQLYRYSLGLSKQQVNACTLASTVQRFASSGLDFRELLVGYVTSDAFRRRPIITN